MGARTVQVPATPVSALLGVAWHLRALPVPGSLLDALLASPVLSSERARTELGWQPRHSGPAALETVLSGIPERGGSTMPPLHRD